MHASNDIESDRNKKELERIILTANYMNEVKCLQFVSNPIDSQLFLMPFPIASYQRILSRGQCSGEWNYESTYRACLMLMRHWGARRGGILFCTTAA